jgi:hypothetical protein
MSLERMLCCRIHTGSVGGATTDKLRENQTLSMSMTEHHIYGFPRSNAFTEHLKLDTLYKPDLNYLDSNADI